MASLDAPSGRVAAAADPAPESSDLNRTSVSCGGAGALADLCAGDLRRRPWLAAPRAPVRGAAIPAPPGCASVDRAPATCAPRQPGCETQKISQRPGPAGTPPRG